MTTISHRENAFTRAVIISVSLHIALFILILLSPYLPKSSKKGMIHYVNVISFGGGGGGGGSGGGSLSGGGNSPSYSEEKMTETSVQERESLGDLTTPQNLKTQNPPSMTYPVDKPKREKSSQKPKKTVIKKSSNSKTSIPNRSAKSGKGTGKGSGLRIGVGNGSGGGGGSSEFAGQIGLSNFPYTYYLQNLHGKISNNWLTAQIQTGLSGAYHTTVLFKIFHNGRISDPKIVESSGVRTMDLSAIRAVRDASPFPPLPPGYEDEYLQIRLIFEHNK